MATLTDALRIATDAWAKNSVLDFGIIFRYLATEYLKSYRPHVGFAVNRSGVRSGQVTNEHLMAVLDDLACKWEAFVRAPPHNQEIRIRAFYNHRLQFTGLGFIRDNDPDVVHLLAIKWLTGQNPHAANRNIRATTVSMKLAHRDSAPHPFLLPLLVGTLYGYLDENQHHLSGLSVVLNDPDKPYPPDASDLATRAEITTWGFAYENIARTDADMYQLLEIVLEMDPVPISWLGPSLRLNVLGTAQPTASLLLPAMDRRLRWRAEFEAMEVHGPGYELTYNMGNIAELLTGSDRAILSICLSQGFETLFTLQLQLGVETSTLNTLLAGLVHRALLQKEQVDRFRRLLTTRCICEDRGHSESPLGRIATTVAPLSVFFTSVNYDGNMRMQSAQCMSCRVQGNLVRIENGGTDAQVLKRMTIALRLQEIPRQNAVRKPPQHLCRTQLHGASAFGWQVDPKDTLLRELPLGKAFSAALHWRDQISPIPKWDMLTGLPAVKRLHLHHLHEYTCGCGSMNMSHAKAMISSSTNVSSAFYERALDGLNKYRTLPKLDVDARGEPDSFWAAVAAKHHSARLPLTWERPKRFDEEDIDLIVDAVTQFVDGDSDLADPRFRVMDDAWQEELGAHPAFALYSSEAQNVIWRAFCPGQSQCLPAGSLDRDWITGELIQETNLAIHHFHGLPALGTFPAVGSRVMCALAAGTNLKEGYLHLHSQSRGKALGYRFLKCLLETNDDFQALLRSVLTSSVPALHFAHMREKWLPGHAPNKRDLQAMGLREADLLQRPSNPYLMASHDMYPLDDAWYAWSDRLPLLPWMQAVELVWEQGGREAPVDSKGRVVERLNMPRRDAVPVAVSKYELDRKEVLAALLQAGVVALVDEAEDTLHVTERYAAMPADLLIQELQTLKWILGPEGLVDKADVEQEEVGDDADDGDYEEDEDDDSFLQVASDGDASE